MWQNLPVTEIRAGHVVIIGSGLAGLSAAVAAADAGVRVTVLTPGRVGCDGSTHRVHALAPWILLTAPWVAGDGPVRFLADLRLRAEGLQRDALTEVFAHSAHEAAEDLCDTLALRRLDGAPVVPPGETVARGLRCLPGRPGPLLAPLVAECQRRGVVIRSRSLAVGLLAAEADRVAGVLVWDRERAALARLDADAVVLACGGVGAVFPRTTSPRWCRGSGVALAGAAGALLHHPHLTQALPVTATPPLYFPTTAALLGSRIVLAGKPMPPQVTLDAATQGIAAALRRGDRVALDPGNGVGVALLPDRVRESPTFVRDGRVPLAIAVHHAIGGVAVDAWGRASLPGLYACGEAAGGVQGRRRMMGTGLLEARIFGKRAGHAAATDAVRRRQEQDVESSARELCEVLPPIPARSGDLEALLDSVLGPLVCARPAAEVSRAAAEIAAWPVQTELGSEDGEWLAALRRHAALAILRSELDGDRGPEGAATGVGEGA
jgi:aspartate oxidase